MKRAVLFSLFAASTALPIWACGSSDEPNPTTTSAQSSASASEGSSGSTGGASASSSSAASTGGANGTGGSGCGMGGMGMGGGGAGPWDCVCTYAYPAPASDHAMLSATTQDPQNSKAVPNVTVKACDKADMTCANPILTAVSDAMGNVSASVPTPMPYGFDGFFQSSSATTVTTNYFFRPIAAPPTMGNIPLPVIRQDQITLIATLTGTMLDPNRTSMAIASVDCDVTSSPGVVFFVSSADASTKILYLSGMGGLPDPAATETGANGAAVVLNVPAGMVTVTARVKATGLRVGTLTGHADKGQVLAFQIGPTP